jgi:malonate transporter and related proteins
VLTVYVLAALLRGGFTWPSRLSRRIHLKDAAFGALVAAFPNTGFMGVPLLVALLGPAAAGPVICMLLATSSSPAAVHRAGAVARRRQHRSGRRAAWRAAARHAEQPAAVGHRGWGAVSRWPASAAGAAGHVVVRMLADAATPVALFTIGAVLWRAGPARRSRTPPAECGRWR